MKRTAAAVALGVVLGGPIWLVAWPFIYWTFLSDETMPQMSQRILCAMLCDDHGGLERNSGDECVCVDGTEPEQYPRLSLVVVR